MNQKYIITGAPGTGKTSIINELKKRGFNCINENSRKIIAKQIIIGGEILPWKNQIAFENKIANMRTQQYLTSADDCICFFDRSALDCIAYLKLNNLEATTEIIENVKKCNFNNIVFFTSIWQEIYVNDSERKEDIRKARKIQDSIINTYKSKGYELVEIPKLSIAERANFIISKI
jgi:predicted ATPase